MKGAGKRNKGHAGEREFCKELTALMSLRIPLERNVDQVRFGGADIISLRPFAIEVKRQESLNIDAWRKQAKSQVSKDNPVPVLAYRQNNKKWIIEVPWMVLSKKKYSTEYDRWLSMSVIDFCFLAGKMRRVLK